MRTSTRKYTRSTRRGVLAYGRKTRKTTTKRGGKKLSAKQIKTLNKTSRVWTTGNKSTIRQLTKGSIPASTTFKRLKGLVASFQKQARQKGISLTKANGRSRH